METEYEPQIPEFWVTRSLPGVVAALLKILGLVKLVALETPPSTPSMTGTWPPITNEACSKARTIAPVERIIVKSS